MMVEISADGFSPIATLPCGFSEAHMLEHPVGLFIQITNMMFQGVFQEFPKLRIAYLEAGAGWVPFMTDRMEEDYEKFAARLAPQLKDPPSKFLNQEISSSRWKSKNAPLLTLPI